MVSPEVGGICSELWKIKSLLLDVQNFPIPEEKLIKLAQKVLLEDEVSISTLDMILQSKSPEFR